MSYSLHLGAAKDLEDAFHFYRREGGAGLALRFLDEFERVTKLIEVFPDVGKSTSADRRSFPLTGFPYSLIYRSVHSHIRILVVRHQNRDPLYGEQRA